MTEAVTRRSFLRGGAAAAVLPSVNAPARKSTFLDLLRAPNEITAYARFEKTLPAGRAAVVAKSEPRADGLVLTLAASTPVAAVHVRWQLPVAMDLRVLGDAWERSYGELGWRDLIPERVMPWYFATHDGVACHGYGVKTDAAALCFLAA